jgi:beta-lactamase regulating signal transducer with metallopeptidase domain
MDKIGFFISGLFNWVVMTSLMASVLVVFILLVKFVLKDNLKMKWQYIIWFVLMLRLILPAAPESSFSMFNLFSFMNHPATAANVSGNTAVSHNIQPVSDPAAAEETSQMIVAEPLENKSDLSVSSAGEKQINFPVHSVFMVIWLLGVTAIVLYLAVTNRKLARKTANCSNITVDYILDTFEQCKKDLRIRRNIPLKTSSTVEGPTLYGFIRPVILLPAKGMEKFSASELRFIFLHELVHYKRKDVFVNWLITLLLILHWFNPILLYAYKKMREDQELSCDAGAISHIHPDEVKEYGYTIIKLLENYRQSSWVPAVAHFSADKSQLKRRIQMITFFKKHSYKWSVLGLAVIIFLSGCALTNSKSKNVDKQQTPTTSESSPKNDSTFPPPKVSIIDQLIYSAFVGKTDGWFLYKSTQLDVYHSSDNGLTWEKSSLPIKQPWEKEIGKENVYVSLHSEQEAQPNWMLLTSGPAAGQMGKSLYQSVDNGKSWTMKGDLSQTIDGYITGITFRNDKEGWIAASQHGKAMLPLYRTQDGGKTWNLQEINIPKDYKYGNASPPSFDLSNDLIGSLKIEFVGDTKKDTLEYTTKDGGKKWTLPTTAQDNTKNESSTSLNVTPTPTQSKSSSSADSNSIMYTNTQYGFQFSLPESWKDYSIVNSKWEGLAMDEKSASEKVVETGPLISIRDPKWTAQTPRQDIPIMLFTLSQWNSLQQGVFNIGAAPIGPSELGRNDKYVFALPARYNYSFPPGYEEVDMILNSKPLKVLESK